jgi:hypothetical protein
MAKKAWKLTRHLIMMDFTSTCTSHDLNPLKQTSDIQQKHETVLFLFFLLSMWLDLGCIRWHADTSTNDHSIMDQFEIDWFKNDVFESCDKSVLLQYHHDVWVVLVYFHKLQYEEPQLDAICPFNRKVLRIHAMECNIDQKTVVCNGLKEVSIWGSK